MKRLWPFRRRWRRPLTDEAKVAIGLSTLILVYELVDHDRPGHECAFR